jgi:glycosyltransferase involved in cell wall biosynthesis
LKPSLITSMFSPEMAEVVRDLSLSADLVHVARLHMVAQVERLFEGLARPTTVLDMDDVETALRARMLGAASSLAGRYDPLDHLELVRLRTYERRTVRRFDRVFVCSERDRRRFRRPNVMVVPNGTDVSAELPKNEPDGRTLLFCGVLSSRQNIDGLEFFVRQILPEIRREIPDARLVIVGRAPALSVRQLDNGQSVLVKADVPSVTEYYRRATLAIVPLRIGTGTRLKILEAWALGVPVVSTTIGVEGLDALGGEHVLIADAPGQFARDCVTLLRTPPLRQQLIRQGRDLVSRAYRWEAIDARVGAIVQELLEHA